MIRNVLIVMIFCTVAAFADVPRAWKMSSSTPAAYAATLDTQIYHGGRASGCLRSVQPVTKRNFAVLLQTVDAGHFQRRHVRLSGFIRTVNVTGWAGLMLRIDPVKGTALAFDNMQNRPITGTTPWTRCEIELEAPAEADTVHFGVVLVGGGEVWLDDVKVEAVGTVIPGAAERRNIRTAPEKPSNLDFEH